MFSFPKSNLSLWSLLVVSRDTRLVFIPFRSAREDLPRAFVQNTRLWQSGDSSPIHKFLTATICDLVLKMYLGFVFIRYDKIANTEMIIMKKEVSIHRSLEIEGAVCHMWQHPERSGGGRKRGERPAQSLYWDSHRKEWVRQHRHPKYVGGWVVWQFQRVLASSCPVPWDDLGQGEYRLSMWEFEKGDSRS